jgi:hypothetical protein
MNFPLWAIEALHICTLTLHFVAMNFLVGGLIVILFGKYTDRWNNPVVIKFVKLFPAALAATVLFGVAPLLIIQLVFGDQIYSASIANGRLWWWIAPSVIIGYLFLQAAVVTKAKQGATSRKGIFLSLALLCFVYVSYVYSSVLSLAEQPDLYAELYAQTQSSLVLNPDVGSYLVRWLHMLLGAVTVGGYFVGLLGRDNERAFALGRAFFLYGMIAASLFGVIYLMTLGDYMKPFMRSSAIWWLTGSVILSFVSLHLFFTKKIFASGGALLFSLWGMVVIRHEVRLLRLADSFTPDSSSVHFQWWPLMVVLLSLAVATAVVWYMVKLFLRRE